MRHTQIKLCGLTDPREAAYANENRVDLIGNVLFFEKSKRNIDIPQAVRIHAELSKEIKKVAVVVSPTIDQLLRIEEAGFDLVQIHGSLPDLSVLLEKTDILIVPAFNGTDFEAFRRFEQMERIAGFLFDAPMPGSGRTFDWEKLSGLMSAGLKENSPAERPEDTGRGKKPCFLAGGLTEENVGEAIRFLHPDGVDVSSGVEYKDRRGKDPEAVKRFVEAVRRADRHEDGEKP